MEARAEFSAGDFHHLGKRAAEEIIQASYRPRCNVKQRLCQQLVLVEWSYMRLLAVRVSKQLKAELWLKASCRHRCVSQRLAE
jgi:hypothetical protein